MRFSRCTRSLWSLAALLFLVLGTSMPLSAAAASSEVLASCTNVGGLISVDTTWAAAGSPYCVTSSVDVVAGVTLTIQPGVTLRFDPGKGMQIDGTLIARGTQASKIVFTSANTFPVPGDWGYINFSPSSVPATFDASGNYVSGSVIQYGAIQYAGVTGTAVPAIQAIKTAPYLDHNIVQNNYWDGIYISDAAQIRITNNQILSNGSSFVTILALAGIYVTQSQLGDSAVVAGNVINGITNPANGFGIMLYSSGGATAMVTGNTVTGSVGGGIFVSSQSPSAITVSGNTVYGNAGGIYAGATGTYTSPVPMLTVSDNIVSGNGGSAIYPGGGIGVSYYGSYGTFDNPVSVLVTGNTIYGNSGGGLGVSVGSNLDPNRFTVTNNTIRNNLSSFGGGIYLSSGVPSVLTGNVITNNSATSTNGGGGVYVCGGCNNYPIKNNDIYGNKAGSPTVPNDIYNGNPVGTSLDVTSNYWGTTDTTVIGQRIWDFFDQVSLGIVTYTPVLTKTIALPDLTVAAMSNPPSTVNHGSGFSLTATTKNAGGGSASATNAGFYLSPTPTKGGGAVKLGGSPVTINLTSGANTTGKASVMVPSTMPTGAYYLIACANDNGLVLESNKTNNCRASTTQVTVQ